MSTTPAEPSFGQQLAQSLVAEQTRIATELGLSIDAEINRRTGLLNDALSKARVDAANELDATKRLWSVDKNAWAAKEAGYLKTIEELRNPKPTDPPVTPPATKTQLIIGAAYFSNANKSDGVREAAGVPYDALRLYGGAGDTDTKVKGYITTAKNAGAKFLLLSFKLPKSWAEMAKDPAWFAARAKVVSDAAKAAGITVYLMFHHEPENDTGTNAGNTKAGRDNWQAMQITAGKAIKGKFANIIFGVCLMGYHSFAKGGSLYSLWNLPAAFPKTVTDQIEFIFTDLYQWYATLNKDGTPKTAWSDLRSQMKQLADFCKPLKLQHGQAEWGLVKNAWSHAKAKTFHADMAQWSCELGASVLCYFNCDAKSTNDPDYDTKFAMEPNGPRWTAWVAVVKSKAKYVLAA